MIMWMAGAPELEYVGLSTVVTVATSVVAVLASVVAYMYRRSERLSDSRLKDTQAHAKRLEEQVAALNAEVRAVAQHAAQVRASLYERHSAEITELRNAYASRLVDLLEAQHVVGKDFEGAVRELVTHVRSKC